MKRAAALVLVLGCHSSRPAVTPAVPRPQPVAQPEHVPGRADVVGRSPQPLAELVVSGRPCGPAPMSDPAPGFDPRPRPMPAPRDPVLFIGKQIDPCTRGTFVDRR